jgi:hypothetical protein
MLNTGFVARESVQLDASKPARSKRGFRSRVLRQSLEKKTKAHCYTIEGFQLTVFLCWARGLGTKSRPPPLPLPRLPSRFPPPALVRFNARPRFRASYSHMRISISGTFEGFRAAWARVDEGVGYQRMLLSPLRIISAWF